MIKFIPSHWTEYCSSLIYVYIHLLKHCHNAVQNNVDMLIHMADPSSYMGIYYHLITSRRSDGTAGFSVITGYVATWREAHLRWQRNDRSEKCNYNINLVWWNKNQHWISPGYGPFVENTFVECTFVEGTLVEWNIGRTEHSSNGTFSSWLG